MKQMTEKQISLFWMKLIKNGECLEWHGASLASGYGFTRVGSRTTGDSAVVLTHRAAYYAHFGVDPAEKFVCHRCDNPKCCNPDHLFLACHKENMADMVMKGRSKSPKLTGEQNGRHVLTDKDVLEIRGSNLSCRELAYKFGVGKSQISRIKSYEQRGTA